MEALRGEVGWQFWGRAEQGLQGHRWEQEHGALCPAEVQQQRDSRLLRVWGVQQGSTLEVEGWEGPRLRGWDQETSQQPLPDIHQAIPQDRCGIAGHPQAKLGLALGWCSDCTCVNAAPSWL